MSLEYTEEVVLAALVDVYTEEAVLAALVGVSPRHAGHRILRWEHGLDRDIVNVWCSCEERSVGGGWTAWLTGDQVKLAATRIRLNGQGELVVPAETPTDRDVRLVRTVELLARQLDSRDATIARYQDLETALYARIGKLALDLEDMERSVALAMEQKGAAEARVRELMAERICAIKVGTLDASVYWAKQAEGAAAKIASEVAIAAAGMALASAPCDPDDPCSIVRGLCKNHGGER